MNPLIDPLYAGIAGVQMTETRFELGHDVQIEQTYAHFMAPFMMAFAPPENGANHPPPWSAVKGGFASDIHVQLFIPEGLTVPNFLDRLNTMWWVVALLRLRGAGKAHVPVVSDKSFQEIPADWEHADLLPIEASPREVHSGNARSEINLEDLEWLKSIWVPGGQLLLKEPVFFDAFQALDDSGRFSSRGVALLAIWGALEALFSPARQELRFRIAANISCYLKPPGLERLELHKRIMKLYNERSSVAHGTRLKSEDALPESYDLLRMTILKILDVDLHLKVIRYLHRKLIHPEEPVWLNLLSFSWPSFSCCR